MFLGLSSLFVTSFCWGWYPCSCHFVFLEFYRYSQFVLMWLVSLQMSSCVAGVFITVHNFVLLGLVSLIMAFCVSGVFITVHNFVLVWLASLLMCVSGVVISVYSFVLLGLVFLLMSRSQLCDALVSIPAHDILCFWACHHCS